MLLRKKYIAPVAGQEISCVCDLPSQHSAVPHHFHAHWGQRAHTGYGVFPLHPPLLCPILTLLFAHLYRPSCHPSSSPHKRRRSPMCFFLQQHAGHIMITQDQARVQYRSNSSKQKLYSHGQTLAKPHALPARAHLHVGGGEGYVE